MASTAAPSPASTRSSSFEKVPQLVGQLRADGTVASLQVDPTYSISNRSNPPRSMKAALDAVAASRRDSSGSGDSGISDTASEEDYDSLKHDPMAVVVGGKGGGFEADPNGSSTIELNGNGKKTYEEIAVVPKSKSGPGLTRLTSIPITLNRLREKGRYILTADDEALREILRIGIERVSWDFSALSNSCSRSIGERPSICKKKTEQV